MKKELLEEIRRIHEITYKNIVSEQMNTSINKATQTVGNKVDVKGKADFIKPSPDDLYNTLERAIKSGGLNSQKYGSMIYQKEVEALQIALIFLGYPLPRFGVDGLFGPETSMAVESFKKTNNLMNETSASPSVIAQVLSLIKSKNINAQQILPYIDPIAPKLGGGKMQQKLQSSLKITDKIKYAINFLIKNGGYTEKQASAIVGNLQAESGLNPSIEGDKHLSSSSVGIAQWRGPRLRKLKSFARKNGRVWNDLETQLWFVVYELKNDYKKVDALIRSNDDLDAITQIVQSKYEVSTPHSLNTRIQYANQFYNEIISNNT